MLKPGAGVALESHVVLAIDLAPGGQPGEVPVGRHLGVQALSPLAGMALGLLTKKKASFTGKKRAWLKLF